MLTILLCIIGFFVILLIALLVLPFSLLAKVERMEAKVGYQIAIRYPWKFLGFRYTFGTQPGGFGMGSDAGQRRMRILIGNKSVYEKSKRKGKKPKKKPQKDEPISTENENISEKPKGKKRKRSKELKEDKPKRKLSDFWQIWDLIRENAKPVMYFLKDILGCFKKARIAGDLEVGISDPALMGMLYGMYWAIPWHKQHGLKVNPNFIDATFSGWIEFETYVMLLPILCAVIKLAFKVPIIKIVRMSRQRKRTMEKTDSRG